MRTDADLVSELYPKFQELKKKLPYICEDYFGGKEAKLNINSRIAYARELLLFFTYLTEKEPKFQKYTVLEFDYDILKSLTYAELQRYFSYMRNKAAFSKNPNKLTQTGKKRKSIGNGSHSMNRKMSILNDFFLRAVRKGHLPSNPMDAIERDTIKEEPIIVMNNADTSAFFHNMKTGDSLKGRSKAFSKRTYERDFAIFTLLEDTGLRISELVHIDIDDIFFEQHMIQIIRKGNKHDTVYMSDTAQDVLHTYITTHRQKMNPKLDERAVFLSLRGTRITARAVEYLTKKYATVIPDKNITPHKFRSTYGTKLYKETNGDILSVAKLLGHNSTDVTQKHYAKYPEERKETLRNIGTEKKEP